MAEEVRCQRCEHGREHHGPESSFYEADGSKREVCLGCPGYEEPGYPHGKAWHRYVQEAGHPQPVEVR